MRRLKEIFNTKLDASARHNQNGTDRRVRKTKRDYTAKSVACNKPHAAAADVNPSPLSPPVPLPCRGPPRCRCHRRHEFRGRRFCHTRHTRKTQAAQPACTWWCTRWCTRCVVCGSCAPAVPSPCPAHSSAARCALLQRSDLHDKKARRELCAKARHAEARTSQAASHWKPGWHPRNPRQACRPASDSIHACAPRQLKAEPSEAAALAQLRLSASPRQQLRSPTRRRERSRPCSWSAEASGPSHGQPGRVWSASPKS